MLAEAVELAQQVIGQPGDAVVLVHDRRHLAVAQQQATGTIQAQVFAVVQGEGKAVVVAAGGEGNPKLILPGQQIEG